MMPHLSRETNLSVTSVTAACKIRVARRRKFLPKHVHVSISFQCIAVSVGFGKFYVPLEKFWPRPLNHIVTNKYLFQSLGSVGKSADSAFLSASVDDPDDAFVGFTYVPPTEDLHE